MSGMARRRWVPGAALAVAAAVMLSVAISSPSAVANGQPRARVAKQQTHQAHRTLRFILRQTHLTLPLEPAVGTSFVGHFDVLDTAATRIGEAGASCAVVKAEADRAGSRCSPP